MVQPLPGTISLHWCHRDSRLKLALMVSSTSIYRLLLGSRCTTSTRTPRPQRQQLTCRIISNRPLKVVIYNTRRTSKLCSSRNWSSRRTLSKVRLKLHRATSTNKLTRLFRLERVTPVYTILRIDTATSIKTSAASTKSRIRAIPSFSSQGPL